jgi:ElaB/YqjD/DUF883 family membrane-anchored ribosome-binding protein
MSWKYCWRCGAQLPVNAIFCIRCGVKQPSLPDEELIIEVYKIKEQLEKLRENLVRGVISEKSYEKIKAELEDKLNRLREKIKEKIKSIKEATQELMKKKEELNDELELAKARFSIGDLALQQYNTIRLKLEKDIEETSKHIEREKLKLERLEKLLQ